MEVLLNHGVVQQFLKSHYPTFRRAVPLTLRSRSLVAGVRIRRSRPAPGVNGSEVDRRAIAFGDRTRLGAAVVAVLVSV